MKENLVIRDGKHFHLRVNDQWYKHQTWDEARWILIRADLDHHKMLASAIKVPEPFDIEYKPLGRHRWWLNGHPVPVACVKYMLRDSGCNQEVIDRILHANKLLYRIEQDMEQRRKLLQTPEASCLHRAAGSAANARRLEKCTI